MIFQHMETHFMDYQIINAYPPHKLKFTKFFIVILTNSNLYSMSDDKCDFIEQMLLLKNKGL